MGDLNKRSSRLEEIQKKLYSKHYVPKHTRAKLRDKEYNLERDWGEDEIVEESTSGKEYFGPGTDFNNTSVGSGGMKVGNKFKPLFIIALIFFIASFGYALYIFNQGNQSISAADVDINIVGPVAIGGGEPLSLDVLVRNNNNVELELVDLIVDYPEGTKDSENLVTDLKRIRVPLGDIAPGDLTRETITAALFGEENSNQEITVGIEYRLPGSNAIFEKEKKFEIVLSTSPVRLAVSGLREISSGQELELTLDVTSNSVKDLENVLVVAKYPFGFTFEESSINPQDGDNIWYFDRLSPNETQTILIKGKIEGQNSEDRVFRFSTGLQDENQSDAISLLWGEILHQTTIQKTFANVSIGINNRYEDSIIINSGTKLNGNISISNNTNDILRDIKIILLLEGEVYDEGSVSANQGFYDSNDNTLIWGTETGDRFDELGPRDSLSLQFNLNTLSLSDANTNYDDPEIKLNAIVEAVRVSDEDVEEEVNLNTFATVKMQSDVPSLIYTVYEEGPFANSGPIPPKAGEPTTYTLVFEVANSSNDLNNVKIEAILPSYVDWNGLVSPASSDVIYDDVSKRITWNAGFVRAGVGYITSPKTMYANVTLTPSATQVGQQVDLVRESKLTAYDTFTETNIVKDLGVTDTKIHNQSIGNNHQTVVE